MEDIETLEERKRKLKEMEKRRRKAWNGVINTLRNIKGVLNDFAIKIGDQEERIQDLEDAVSESNE